MCQSMNKRTKELFKLFEKVQFWMTSKNVFSRLLWQQLSRIQELRFYLSKEYVRNIDGHKV